MLVSKIKCSELPLSRSASVVWSGCQYLVVVCVDFCLLAGPAATADICSNMTSIRMVQTTREKISEWSDALLATAAAGTAQGVDMHTSHNTTVTGPEPPAAAGLPLAPWAWAYSSSCGCRDRHSSHSAVRVGRSGGPTLFSAPGQLLRSQRPLLQDCLQEISSAAASVHRRAIQYLT